MDGAVTVEIKGKRHELGGRGYAYLPEGFSHRVVAKEKSRVAVVEKQYERNAKIEPPHLLVSNENAAARFLHFRSEEHTSELQSQSNLVCRLLLDQKHALDLPQR